jgi:hypothetical protein
LHEMIERVVTQAQRCEVYRAGIRNCGTPCSRPAHFVAEVGCREPPGTTDIRAMVRLYGVSYSVAAMLSTLPSSNQENGRTTGGVTQKHARHHPILVVDERVGDGRGV